MSHVLVVDDDDMIRDVLFDFLMEEGYQVTLARNGREALAVLERERGLVVLLDLSMPGLDGPGVIRWLQEAQRLAQHKVIVITSGQHTAQERRWLEAKAIQAVLRKPFNVDKLLALVQQVAAQARPA